MLLLEMESTISSSNDTPDTTPVCNETPDTNGGSDTISTPVANDHLYSSQPSDDLIEVGEHKLNS